MRSGILKKFDYIKYLLKLLCHLNFLINHKLSSSVTYDKCIIRDLNGPQFKIHIRVFTSKFHGVLYVDNPNLSPFSRQKFINITAYDHCPLLPCPLLTIWCTKNAVHADHQIKYLIPKIFPTWMNGLWKVQPNLNVTSKIKILM